MRLCVCARALQLCVWSHKHVRSWFTPSRPRRDKALFSHDFATFSQTSVSPLNGPNNSFSQAGAAVGSLVKRDTQSTGAHHRSSKHLSTYMLPTTKYANTRTNIQNIRLPSPVHTYHKRSRRVLHTRSMIKHTLIIKDLVEKYTA